MSHISIPFPLSQLNPENLEELLDSSRIENPIGDLQQTFSDKSALRLRGLNLSADALKSQAGDFIADGVRDRIVDLLNYQANLGFQITFVISKKEPKEQNPLQQVGQAIGVRGVGDSNEVVLPHAPLLSLRLKNKMDSKAVSRRPTQTGNNKLAQGNTKENWGSTDIEINISGVFLANRRNYPLGHIQNLHKVFTAGHVGVRHTLLNSLGIQQLFIQDINLAPTKGYNQKYTIKALSDNQDYELLKQESPPEDTNPSSTPEITS